MDEKEKKKERKKLLKQFIAHDKNWHIFISARCVHCTYHTYGGIPCNLYKIGEMGVPECGSFFKDLLL